MHGKISTFTAIITLTRLCLGPGLLVLPFATTRGGLIFAPIGIFIVAAWNGLSCLMVIKCRHASLSQKSLDTKFNKDEEALLLSTYSEVAFAGLGYFGLYLADFCVVVTLLGVCCAYQINFATLLAGISFLKDYHISIPVLIVFSSMLVYPLSCAKDLSVLASISLIGLICILVNCAAVLIYGMLLFNHDHIASASFSYIEHSSPDIPMFPSTYGNMTSYFGVAVFCFGICAFIFPIEENMQNPHDFAGAVFNSLCLVCLVYILVGDGAAFLYNDVTSGHISSNILLNLPVDSISATIARLSMAAVCILTYPLTLLPPATMIEKMIVFYLKGSQSLSTPAGIVLNNMISGSKQYSNDDVIDEGKTIIDSATSLLANNSTNLSYHSHSASNNTFNSSSSSSSSSSSHKQYQPVPLSYTDFSEVIVETLPYTKESVTKKAINKKNQLNSQIDDNGSNDFAALKISSSSSSAATKPEESVSILSWQLKATIRFILVTISTLTAGYVPCFGAVVSLLGCFTLSILSFVLPPLLYFRLVTLPALCKSTLSPTNSIIILSKTSRNPSKSRLNNNNQNKKRKSQKGSSQDQVDDVCLSNKYQLVNNTYNTDNHHKFNIHQIKEEEEKGFHDDNDNDNDYNNDVDDDDSGEYDVESRISEESHETEISHESYISPRYESNKIISTSIQQTSRKPSQLLTQPSTGDESVSQMIYNQPETWLPPKLQAVMDIILIFIGLVISIVGTVITFNQIRSSTAQC